MKVLLAILVVILAVAGGGTYWWLEQRQEQAVERAQYEGVVAKLSSLFADAYEPKDVPARALDDFHKWECKDEWAQAPRSLAARLADVEKILEAEPKALERLRYDQSPSASYVLGMLLLKSSLAANPAFAGIDPEVPLQRAADKGHGHALYYFARMMVNRYPSTKEEPGDAEMFINVDRRLEQAANAGSGGAAYQLGFRTQAHILQRFPVTKDSNKSAYVPTRTASDWWCRSAQLGYASGQLYCYHYGNLRRSEATKWLMAAAEAGHPVANFRLGRLYGKSDGAKAKEFFCRSLALGYTPATRWLRRLSDPSLRAGNKREAKPDAEVGH